MLNRGSSVVLFSWIHLHNFFHLCNGRGPLVLPWTVWQYVSCSLAHPLLFWWHSTSLQQGRASLNHWPMAPCSLDQGLLVLPVIPSQVYILVSLAGSAFIVTSGGRVTWCNGLTVEFRIAKNNFRDTEVASLPSSMLTCPCYSSMQAWLLNRSVTSRACSLVRAHPNLGWILLLWVGHAVLAGL